ncbi:potassium transporter [Aspergillus vadensis CBS 113365]|uniref:Ankyrin repeat-containing protein n=1 Tax=Aspergillus vadensis (strain CBS 113365 / IMI 142717 / IBT 24658) TaxID=1448311 RepID=A0A319BGB0_ASPVC|nr:ankyrin repeat-containing protein [Aspergillus vadensis CBS 113365]PYH72216.1 ankyrin repeat-containing protein [Aspergillus vadensis CBS 113365]
MPPRESVVDNPKSPLRRCHHYIYIISWALLSSLILYCAGGISYVDALLLASGAATQTGLNTVDLNRLHVVQQVTLLVVSMVTNVIFVHSLLVVIRLYWFRKRFKRAINEAKMMCRAQRNTLNQRLADVENGPSRSFSRERPSEDTPLLSTVTEESLTASPSESPGGRKYGATGSMSPHITFCETDAEHEVKQRRRTYSGTWSRRSFPEIDSPQRRRSFSEMQNDMPPLPSLMWQSSIASYSDWNEAQKEELGGIEYRALKTLFVILVCYYVVIHLLGALLFLVWILPNKHYGQILADNGLSRPWWAIFTAGSAFNDLGFTLTPNSMGSFNTAVFPLLVMTFLIVLGNTGFPCMLRFIIWTLSQFTTYGSPLDDELQFLLDHPRRCFTLLFPSTETWRLAAVLLLINAIDLIIFYTLQEFPHPSPISAGLRLVNGLFQIASTRTAGFTIASLGTLHPAVQVSFVGMMYISAFPIAIAMRKTNVYEERSLGIYNEEYDEHDKPHQSDSLGAHIQRQLGFDLWFVMLGFFFVAVAEGKRLQENRTDIAFSLFPILFEIVSAYGTVGLSMGYPGTETSLCREFNGLSKVIVIAMQVRGRHRGLPHALDHAILLPCDLVEPDEQGRRPEWWWKRWIRKKSSDLGNLFTHD